MMKKLPWFSKPHSTRTQDATCLNPLIASLTAWHLPQPHQGTHAPARLGTPGSSPTRHILPCGHCHLQPAPDAGLHDQKPHLCSFCCDAPYRSHINSLQHHGDVSFLTLQSLFTMTITILLFLLQQHLIALVKKSPIKSQKYYLSLSHEHLEPTAPQSSLLFSFP